jgi:hypothetical protein
MKTKKPFILFSMNKKGKVSQAAKKRLETPMRDQVTECEWLAEAQQSTPESALGIAVLQRAVLDLITPGVPHRNKKDALDWIRGRMGDQFEREYPLSFSRIVEHFSEFEVEEFRAKILKFADKAVTDIQTADEFRFQRN